MSTIPRTPGRAGASILIAVVALAGLAAAAAPAQGANRLEDIIAGEHRTPAFAARDRYRHPLETLRFFGVEPDMSVAEIWPSTGWYAEILAPYLKEHGRYYAVGFSLSAERTPQWRRDMARELIARFEADPGIFGATIVTSLSVPEDTEIAPPGSLDRVLTFRNVHNWMKGEYADGVFAAMYRALKPGGLLGVVEHRAAPGTSLAAMIQSGYVTEAQVIALAEAAGFEFLDSSEINANPQDTRNHPAGVWSLPPSLRLGAENRDKYLAIGESDRMTLRFRKP